MLLSKFCSIGRQLDRSISVWCLMGGTAQRPRTFVVLMQAGSKMSEESGDDKGEVKQNKDQRLADTHRAFVAIAEEERKARLEKSMRLRSMRLVKTAK